MYTPKGPYVWQREAVSHPCLMWEGNAMALYVTLCRTCTRSRPELSRMVSQLIGAYAHELVIVELECMAACDDMPALMLDAEYFPEITAEELERAVCERLGAPDQEGLSIAAGASGKPAQ
jgi:hypothetical protein